MACGTAYVVKQGASAPDRWCIKVAPGRYGQIARIEHDQAQQVVWHLRLAGGCTVWGFAAERLYDAAISCWVWRMGGRQAHVA